MQKMIRFENHHGICLSLSLSLCCLSCRLSIPIHSPKSRSSRSVGIFECDMIRWCYSRECLPPNSTLPQLRHDMLGNPFFFFPELPVASDNSYKKKTLLSYQRSKKSLYPWHNYKTRSRLKWLNECTVLEGRRAPVAGIEEVYCSVNIEEKYMYDAPKGYQGRVCTKVDGPVVVIYRGWRWCERWRRCLEDVDCGFEERPCKTLEGFGSVLLLV